ncbi:MBL fold metallo-hydrolase [Polynucleobacter sp. MG-27-Goln-C1]|uniref:MBL fold metallo-hydrolase n=1 Tax=Polynucleobacter sp. MG-27-Goln-C1 TaxID=1819726 RepID=UPI001C0B4E71|nr:MBL fold metallo-hydrolase [Polynucleobacter sp. MG-27-Goln-C1]MBU3612867.1 MBL fold metallo-hydrolase [Polynucleobacter sp. MG-27-Goln-C1]
MSNTYQVAAVVNGAWKQNCYLLTNEKHELIIIDPGSNAGEIISRINDLDATPLAILNTHAHYDHIGAVSALVQKFSIPFYLHKKDEGLMKQANLYKILFESKDSIAIPLFDKDLATEEKIFFIGDFKIEIIHTPGHTPGGVCIVADNNIFGGDTLMYGGPGSTHLPGGDIREMESSMDTLRQLPGEFLVYPGHGRPFTLNTFWSKNFASQS